MPTSTNSRIAREREPLKIEARRQRYETPAHDLAGVGCSRYRDDAPAHVKNLLSKHGGVEFAVIWPSVLETVPVRLTHLKKILAKMKAEGTIAFELPPRKQVPQPHTCISLPGPNRKP